MTDRRVSVLGASSLVGAFLLPQLVAAGWQVRAFSRRPEKSHASDTQAIRWQRLPDGSEVNNPVMTGLSGSLVKAKSPPPEHFHADTSQEIQGESGVTGCPYWISLAPLWVLPPYFSWMAACGARRVVAVSSTSRWVKTASSDPAERLLAENLVTGEQELIHWAVQHRIEWVILRPTLIYGEERDSNISRIARFIRRFGFFPLLGEGRGLRQPLHAQEVATACRQVLEARPIANQAYDISGGETLSYHDMVCRVFEALGCRPRIMRIPLWCFRLAVMSARLLPTGPRLSVAMAERMNQDLVFDHSAASREWGFSPGPFQPAFGLSRDRLCR